MRVQSQIGFTLIEAIMVMAVATIVGLGIFTMLQNQLQHSVFLDDKAAHRELKTEISNLLNDPMVCSESLRNIRLPSVASGRTVTNLALKNSSGVLYDTTSKNVFEKLTITGISLQNEDITGAATSGRARLIVDVARQRSGGGPTQLQQIEKMVNLDIDPGRLVTGCKADSEPGACLKPFQYSILSGVAQGSGSVDAGAKALRAVIMGGSHSSGGGSGGSSCTTNNTNVLIPLDGSLHSQFVPGKTVQITSNGAGRRSLYYDGVLVAHGEYCQCMTSGGGCTSYPAVISYETVNSPICHTVANPAPTGLGVTAYK